MTSNWPGRRPGLLVVVGGAAALGVGIAASHLTAAMVGLLTLLPFVSHVRWVGWRRAVSEPSAITIILLFYLCVFPQRGLALVTTHLPDVDIVRGAVTTSDLIKTLLLASLGTTVLVEAFHYSRRPRVGAQTPPRRSPAAGVVVAPLAAMLGALALGALAVLVLKYHGLAGAQAHFISHSKNASLTGARSLAESVWATLAVPAAWCCALVAVDRATEKPLRVSFGAAAALLVLAQLVVFGSRLNALLALMGAWVVVHYSGRRIPASAVLGSILVLVLVSLPIISQRPGGEVAGLPTQERISRVVGYGVLEASLAVRQQPTAIRQKLDDPRRWLDLPAYLVPSFVWPGKPSLDSKRLDLYVAQSLGDLNQQDTGFPAGYVTELWLYNGWPAVLLVSALLGLMLGRLHRRLVGSTTGRVAASSLIWYCFVLTCAFSYFKDGDILMNVVGDARTGLYLGLAMLAFGVWLPFGPSRRSLVARSARRVGAGYTPALAAPSGVRQLAVPFPAYSVGEVPRRAAHRVVSSEPSAAVQPVVLYIMNEYPSVSETFVVNEAAAVRSLGVRVIGYGLRRGSARRSAADVDLVHPPAGRAELVIAVLTSGMGRTVAQAARMQLSKAETVRLALARGHAKLIGDRCAAAGVTHVHAHFLGRPADVASALSDRLGCRWTATAHGDDIYAPAEPRLLRMRLKRVDGVACANATVRELLDRRAPQPVATKVVHCGVDAVRLPFRPRARPADAAPRLVTVGRLVPTKGYRTILDAAETVMNRDRAIRWTIVGDGPLQGELEREARLRDLAPRLEVIGATDHQAILGLLEQATAFVLPCEVGAAGDSDGIPVALMEAMALGVPVITTHVGGISELVVPDETGFVIPQKDPGALTAALEHLLYSATSESLEGIRSSARAKIETDFALAGEARSLIEFWDARRDARPEAPSIQSRADGR